MKSFPLDCLGGGEGDGELAHARVCADCRVARRLREDFEVSAGPEVGDERLLDRVVARAVHRAAPRRARVGRTFSLAAGLLLFVAGVASGSIFAHLHVRPEDGDSPRRSAPVRRSSASHHAAVEAIAPPAQAEPAAAAPSSSVSSVATAQTGRARVVATPVEEAPIVRSARAPAPEAWSHILLRQALEARRDGRRADSIEAFRSLQSQCAGSKEALLSYVSLGGLLLESGQGDEALAAFDSYLAAAPSGGLVPESLAGRARALKSVGREAEAARAWRELARRYPDSPYAGPRTLLTP